MENLHQKQISIAPGEWGEVAAGLVAPAVDFVDDVRIQVEAGAAKVFFVLDGALIIGCFVLRIDHDSQGAEGVIVAAGGACRGVDLVASCLPAVEQLFIGVSRVRIHTERPGLEKKLQALGYFRREVVYVKELKNG